MPTPRFIKDLYMLQETVNGSFEIGADLVRKADVELWFQHFEIDPDGRVDWAAVYSALQSWEASGYIKILADPTVCKHKDYCFKTLREITAISPPTDLAED